MLNDTAYTAWESRATELRFPGSLSWEDDAEPPPAEEENYVKSVTWNSTNEMK